MVVSCLFMVCLSLVSTENMSHQKAKDRANNCVFLAETAMENGLRPHIIMAIAHTESRFSLEAKSSAGAVGIMQVLPQYWCPSRGKCDYTQAGIRAWTIFKRGRTTREALCRYATGKSCKKSGRAAKYARTVLKKFRFLNREFDRLRCDDEDEC